MPTSPLSLVSNIESRGRVPDYAYEFAEATQCNERFGSFSLNECNIFRNHTKCFGMPRNTPIDFVVMPRESLDAVAREHPSVANKFISLLLQQQGRRLREFSSLSDGDAMIGACS